MTSKELRAAFIGFFKKNNHTIVPSSSLLSDDTSVLLTTAGMQQFKPYYTGELDPFKSPHPTLGGKPLGSKNTASVQKSFRTSDIEEVGDKDHLTFFEMLGNFSFGGYFKKEAIQYAKEFLNSLNLSIEYVTVFEGDEEVSKDEESEKIWNSIGFSKENGNLRFANREENWWGPTGNEGPCGPTTEVFINGTEVWNLVFNEYYSHQDGHLEKLKTPGVDTGIGFERLVMVSQKKENIFETDLFKPLMDILSKNMEEKKKRVCADHARAIAFLVSDGVRPSNKEAGYILRRLMRRLLVYEYLEKDKRYDTVPILKKTVEMFGEFYPNLNTEETVQVFSEERDKFKTSLARGLRELERLDTLDASSAFRLYESFGVPYEIIKELGGKKADEMTLEAFEKEVEQHKEVSRAGAGKKFGGHGLLLDTGELKAGDPEELNKVTRLHTASHLLQAALRKVLGPQVKQAGSDITPERTRFDFTFDRKLTNEEIKEVESLVNQVIEKNLEVSSEEMPYQEAVATGALFVEKGSYPAQVSVYSVGEFSKELCGGPHVAKTKEIGRFRITKQESVSAGVRRIRGTIEGK